MLEQSFTWGQATITVKAATIRMFMRADRFESAIAAAIPDADMAEAYWFAKVCVQATIEGDLSWSVPSLAIEGQELAESFDYFYEQLPESFIKALIRAIRAVDGPYVSAEFGPPSEETKALDPKD
jgi:hypothetical protein